MVIIKVIKDNKIDWDNKIVDKNNIIFRVIFILVLNIFIANSYGSYIIYNIYIKLI